MNRENPTALEGWRLDHSQRGYREGRCRGGLPYYVTNPWIASCSGSLPLWIGDSITTVDAD